jgi:hypothetical protein
LQKELPTGLNGDQRIKAMDGKIIWGKMIKSIFNGFAQNRFAFAIKDDSWISPRLISAKS